MHTKKLKQFAAGEFKAKCLQIMDEVQNTKIPVVVTKHGKPVVTIVPFEERKVFPYGAMQHQIKINGDIVGPLREPWNAESDS